MSDRAPCRRLRAWARLAVTRLGFTRIPAGAAAAAETGSGLVVPSSTPAGWSWPWVVAAAVVVLAALGTFLARPVEDGDLWWHLAYARDMLARHTLIPDHTLYSWTPANADHIYCAWLGQLVLYGAYRLGGLPLLFGLRYAAAGVVLLIVWRHAHRLGLAAHPLLAPVLVASLLMCLPALMLKASLFSPPFLALTVYVWYRARTGGDLGWRWWYALPVLMAVWVNTHGGWVCGALLLVLLAAGEILNALFVPRLALSPRLLRHLWCALALAALAILATPYGIWYPLRLARSLLRIPGADLRTVRDYDPVFVWSWGTVPFMLAFALAAGLLLWLLLLTWRRRGWDWALLAPNLAFAFFYARMVRMTFAWGAVFGMSVLYLLTWLPEVRWPSGRRRRLALASLSLAAALGLAGVYSGLATRYPAICSWVGFGISYINPVSEAEFIRTHLAGCRLGNDYNSGGYLLWRLPPETRVFIDPRYFPYRSWYGDYRRLENAQEMEEFLERYPCDAWCINLRLGRTVQWFTSSKDWTPVCYGPAAVIFARRGTRYAKGGLTRCPDVVGIRNLGHAAAVTRLALSFQDIRGARAVTEGIDLLCRWPGQRAAETTLRHTVRGLIAFRHGQYALAVSLLSEAVIHAPSRGLASTVLLQSLHRLTEREWHAGSPDEALEWTLQGLRQDPANPVFLYNAGVLGWLAAGKPVPATGATDPASDRGNTTWESHLGAYLASRRPAQLTRQADPVAQRLIEGRWDPDKRPPLILPPPR